MANALTILCGRFVIASILVSKLCVGTRDLFRPSNFEYLSRHKYPTGVSVTLIICVQTKLENALRGPNPGSALEEACHHIFSATRAKFGPPPVNEFVGYFQQVDPVYGCENILKTPSVNASDYPSIAIIRRGNCSFYTKVANAERAGFGAAIVYGFQEDPSLVVMDASASSSPVSIPSYFVNYTSGTILASLQSNASHSHLLTILAHTTPMTAMSGQIEPDGSQDGDNDTDDDSFGEHYFHICIYIWGCVVVSSLIALSVKWGCCGRSLTRWELRRIPLKRFQRAEGDDYQEKCPICHEEFHEGRLIRQLPCNHCYHSYCVDRWLMKMSNRCPLCKQRVSISLFCPWNKQRRKKEIHGHVSSDADAEASMDESPPLPPLATLTPSNWYGEAIMSGPSKFIIMRPGRPTRVIDIREQNKKTKSVSGSQSDGEKGHSNLCSSGCDGDKCHAQNFDEITTEHDSDNINTCDCVNSGRFPEQFAAAQTIQVNCNDEDDDDDEVLNSEPRMRSPGSSRSCSVSSDQPLLVESQDEALTPTHGLSAPGSANLKLCRTEDLSSGNGKHTRQKDNLKGRAVKHSGGGICRYKPGFLDEEHNIMSDATVTLSCGSSSVVSGNIKTPDFESKSRSPFNPTRSKSQTITHLSSSPEIPKSFLQEDFEIDIGHSAVHNKRYTVPNGVREVWNPHETRANKDFSGSNQHRFAAVEKHAGHS